MWPHRLNSEFPVEQLRGISALCDDDSDGDGDGDGDGDDYT